MYIMYRLQNSNMHVLLLMILICCCSSTEGGWIRCKDISVA